MNQGIGRSLSVPAMALLLTVTLAACGTVAEESEPTVTRVAVEGAPPTRMATVPGEASPAPGSDATAGTAGQAGDSGGAPTTFEVDMVELAFEPSEIIIPADTDVTITAVNAGSLPHTFTITDVADTGEVASGESAEVTVNLPAGEYDFLCAVPGHADGGMTGKLIVEEGGAQASPSPGSAGSPEASPVAGSDSTASGGPVALDMVELAFEPAEFEIPADTPTTINLTNSGALPHNFSITDQDVSVDLEAGGSTSFEVNLPAGEYEFFCAVPGHADGGMVGTLTVT